MKKMQPRIRVRLKHKNQPTEDGMMLERSAATEPTGCEQSVAEEETMPANNGRTTEEPETTTAESGQRPDAEKKIAKVSNFAKATYGIGMTSLGFGFGLLLLAGICTIADYDVTRRSLFEVMPSYFVVGTLFVLACIVHAAIRSVADDSEIDVRPLRIGAVGWIGSACLAHVLATLVTWYKTSGDTAIGIAGIGILAVLFYFVTPWRRAKAPRAVWVAWHTARYLCLISLMFSLLKVLVLLAFLVFDAFPMHCHDLTDYLLADYPSLAVSLLVVAVAMMLVVSKIYDEGLRANDHKGSEPWYVALCVTGLLMAIISGVLRLSTDVEGGMIGLVLGLIIIVVGGICWIVENWWKKTTDAAATVEPKDEAEAEAEAKAEAEQMVEDETKVETWNASSIFAYLRAMSSSVDVSSLLKQFMEMMDAKIKLETARERNWSEIGEGAKCMLNMCIADVEKHLAMMVERCASVVNTHEMLDEGEKLAAMIEEVRAKNQETLDTANAIYEKAHTMIEQARAIHNDLAHSDMALDAVAKVLKGYTEQLPQK